LITLFIAHLSFDISMRELPLQQRLGIETSTAAQPKKSHQHIDLGDGASKSNTLLGFCACRPIQTDVKHSFSALFTYLSKPSPKSEALLTPIHPEWLDLQQFG
jgi:hypothetical protein